MPQFSIFIYLFFFLLLPANAVNANDSWSGRYSKLDQVFTIPEELEKISFESDIPFDSDEFYYLVGLKQGQTLVANDIKNACFYLEQRNLFSKINVVVGATDKGCSLHFKLKSYQRLGKVYIEGVLFGKDRYRRMYNLEDGSRFSESKHKHAVKKLTLKLKNDGFLNAGVQSSFDVDQATNLVNVKLKLNMGEQFVVSGISCLLQDPVGDDCSECGVLNQQVFKILKKNLVGSKYSRKKLKQDIRYLKKYLARNGYPFAQIKFDILKNKTTHQVKINLTAFLHKKQCYKFTGNSYYNDDDLLDYIMFSGDPIWNLPISLVIKDISDLYIKNGFWLCEVDGFEEQDCYKFSITEGPRAVIKKVSIRGLDSFGSKFFAKKYFGKVLSNRFYDKDILKSCITNITDWFIQSGFWNFKVLDTEFVKLAGQANYEMVVVVDEGIRRYLRGGRVVGYENLCLPYASVDKGLPFRPCYLQDQKKWIENYFLSQGYHGVKVYPKVQDHDKGDVFVEWDVKRDEPIYLGKIVRGGNAKISFKKLYQMLPNKDGDIWDKSRLEEIFLQIKNLDAFDSVRIYPSSELDKAGKKPLFLYLNLDNKLEFRNRLGFQKVSKNFSLKSGATYKVGASVLYKNMTNRGDQLRFDADLTKYYRSIVAQYKVPVFIKVPLYLATKVYSNKYDQPIFIGSKKRLYNVCQQGAVVDIGYKGSVFNSGFNFGFEGVRVGKISKEYASAIDFSSDLLSEQVPFLFVEPTILIDCLDDKLNPHKGVLSLATLKGMFSMGREHSYFLKMLVEQSMFLPAFKKSTLAFRFRFGHLFTNSFETIMPIERFYLGGANSIRSFESDFAPPLGKVKAGENDIFVPQGGKTMLNASFEFRFPIYQNFGAVIFQDLGTLLKKGANLGEGELLTATGFGLRYMTPVGPLRFDIGWRPRRFVEDSNFAWFLTIGHTF